MFYGAELSICPVKINRHLSCICIRAPEWPALTLSFVGALEEKVHYQVFWSVYSSKCSDRKWCCRSKKS